MRAHNIINSQLISIQIYHLCVKQRHGHGICIYLLI